MGRLASKVALITGAARGQGRSHAVRLAREGADIVAIDSCRQMATVPWDLATPEDLAETAELVRREGRRVVAVEADVRDLAGLKEAAAAGVKTLGRLDIVVANAGIGSVGSALELPEDEWDDTIDVDLKGPWLTCKAAVPYIIEHGEGGAVILTSSAVGLHGIANACHYVAAKHGVVGLMRALAIEFAPHRIRVNSVHPTQVDTPMFMNATMRALFCPDIENPTKQDLAERIQSAHAHALPVPWIEVEDVSNAIAFLVSEEARFVTGVAFPVDAGADLLS